MQKITSHLSEMPMGAYNVAYYVDGREGAQRDIGVGLAYVEHAAQSLEPNEGMVAVCTSQHAPALVRGRVPLPASPDGRRWTVISRGGDALTLQDNRGNDYSVSIESLRAAAAESEWYQTLLEYVGA